MILLTVKLLLPLLLITSVFVHQIEAAIDEEDGKNDDGQVLYHVYDENKVKILNRHREKKPPLKLSIHGTSIEKIDKKSATLWTWQLGDKSVVDFSVIEKAANVTEYYLLWHGGGPNADREICFSYGYNHASWFSAYQGMNASWPMDVKKTIVKQQFNFLFNYDRYSKPEIDLEHLFILEQLYFNSDGYAIMLDYQSPLFIKRTSNGDDPVMCFSVNNVTPYMASNHEPSYLDLKVRIFASTNIRTVTDYVVHQSGYIAKPTSMPDTKMFESPAWFTLELAISGLVSVNAFTNDLTSNGFTSNNKIILYGWSPSDFDSIIKTEAYPEESLITNLHKHKFEVGLKINEAFLIKHEVINSYFVNNSEYIDFSNPDACKLLNSIFVRMRFEKQIDLFYLSAHNVYTFDILYDQFVLKYPSLLTTKYVEKVSQVGNTAISEYAFKTQNLPVWVRLTNYKATPNEQLLMELIPNVLSVSIAGYSFILPYSAGGLMDMPSEEIFIRMIQAIALMPSISLAKKPWDYSAKAVEITKKFVNLHSEHASTMIELAKKRITDGSPIIRPMWYVAPDDPKTHSIGDQYMLGEDILVAPVVKIGQTERTVYLIAGTWNDQHGKSYQGPGEFKVAAPLEELPYFKRKL